MPRQRLLQCLHAALFTVPLLKSASLPKPSGTQIVGSRSFVWTDRSRTDALRTPSEPRTLSVRVYYPADSTTGTAGAYLPDWPLWISQIGEARLRESFGAAFPAAGSVTTAVRQNARISKKSGPFPFLVFLPGLGMNIEVYTALLSDLASHGYVVLAINPTYEVFAATISKDKAVGFSSPGWFRPPVERIIEYEKGRLVVWAADGVFAIGQLKALPDFKKRVNWQKIGALGHSAGARVVAHLCQTEVQVSACLNLDGFAGFQPFFAEDGSVFSKAFAMIHMVIPDPTNEQLARTNTSRDDMLKEKARQRNAGIRLFESVRGGSVEVTISTAGFGHGSFTDLPIIGGSAGDPLRGMTHIRTYALAFFDGALKGVRKTALDRDNSDADVLPERYTFKGPASNR
jgi:predicted dienelactone hydrolase